MEPSKIVKFDIEVIKMTKGSHKKRSTKLGAGQATISAWKQKSFETGTARSSWT